MYEIAKRYTREKREFGKRSWSLSSKRGERDGQFTAPKYINRQRDYAPIVRTVNLNQKNSAPTVRLDFDEFNDTLKFMLDTGAGPNLAKLSTISPNTEIERNNILLLRGITPHFIETLGKITVKFNDFEVNFHIVSDDFPIKEDGILGSDFFRQTNAKINYLDEYLEVGRNVILFESSTAEGCYDAQNYDFRQEENVQCAELNSQNKVRNNLVKNNENNVSKIGPEKSSMCNKENYNEFFNKGKQNFCEKNVIENLKTDNENVFTVHDYFFDILEGEFDEGNFLKSLSLEEKNNNNEKSYVYDENEMFIEEFRNMDFGSNDILRKRCQLCHETLEDEDLMSFENLCEDCKNYCRDERESQLIEYLNGEDIYEIENSKISDGIAENFSSNIESENISYCNCIDCGPTIVKGSNESIKILNFVNDGNKISESSKIDENTNDKNNDCQVNENNEISTDKNNDSEMNKTEVNSDLGNINDVEPSRIDKIKSLLKLDHLPWNERDIIESSVELYADQFHIPGEKLLATNIIKHQISTTDDIPVHAKQYTFPPDHNDVIKVQLKKLLDDEIIVPSESKYASSVLLMRKKIDNENREEIRMLIDFRELNKKIIADNFTLPNENENIEKMKEAKFFSSFNLSSGFYAIEIDENDRHKTAFLTPCGKYEFVRMPPGLESTFSTYQRCLYQALLGLEGIILCKDHDVTIYANSISEYNQRYQNFLERLKLANLQLELDSCDFLKRQIRYLGHVIGEENIRPDTEMSNVETTRFQTVKTLLRLDYLSTDEREIVESLVEQYSDQFHIPGEKLSATKIIQHRIPTIDDIPVNAKQYRIPPIHREEINRQVKELLDNGIIVPSESGYSSPIWVVEKKPDSQNRKRYRLVLDFRELNKKTIAFTYPIPNINDILDQLKGAKYFSVFDLASSFHQIEVLESDRHKTAFCTAYGKYEFVRMPFGLISAPCTFQKCVDQAFIGLQGFILYCYIDDVVLYASTIEEHNQKFHQFMERMRIANLKLQPDKCEFLKREVTYLGHLISEQGVKPDPKKVEAVRHFPVPKTVKNVRQFLGLAGYYRRFINGFSKIAKPLTNLLKINTVFEWNEETHTAFEILKDKLCEHPVLQFPDFNQPFILTTDASGFAIGGILSQGEIGKDRPIAYTSRVLNDAERRYPTYELEALAIVYCVRHFRHYLIGRKFTILTDHKPLIWFQNSKDPNSRVSRWRLKLSEFEYQIVYKAGKTNVNADALSRNPVDLDMLNNVDENCDFEINDQPCPNIYVENENQHEETVFVYETRTRAGKLAPQNYRYTREKAANNTRKNPRRKEPVQKQNDGNLPTNQNLNELNIDNFQNETLDEPTSIDNAHQNDGRIINDEPSNDIINQNAQGTQVTGMTNEHNEIINRRVTGKIFAECREQLFMRKDNYMYFVSTKGEPCDVGAISLRDKNELPRLANLEIGKVTKIIQSNKFHLVIPIRGEEKVGQIIISENITQAFKNLKTIIETENLRSISIAKNKDIENLPWNDIMIKLRTILRNVPVKIIICLGLVKYPALGERKAIIEEAHCSAVGGHKGVTKTYKRIRQKYHWEGLKEEVQQFIQRCLSCQLKKLVRVKTKNPMVITDTPTTAFQKISMDIVGPFPKTRKGHDNILTIQCALTKYSLAIPLPDATAKSVADALIKRFICLHGAPSSCLSDQGSNFLSNLMKRVAKRFRIKQFKTTAFHPQSNGSIERSHHSLAEYLKSYISKDEEWDEWLDLATFSYNTSVHESTNHTPYELVYGRLPRLPSSDPLEPEDLLPTYDNYLVNLTTKIHQIQEIARDKLIDTKWKSKYYYDKKINPRTFKIGDYVWLLKGGKRHKFADQYEGPYLIIDVINRDNIKIQLHNKTPKVVHINRLRISRIEE